jgi:uncharacterized protein YodC (DUF2158 family)
MKDEEMQAIFPKGSKVRLNIGGPVMVVKGYWTNEGSPEVICQWFVGKKLEQGLFARETLEFVKEDSADASKKS